ncbi:hypothetical protein GCM10022275_20390 [Tessaracoccus defluvii]
MREDSFMRRSLPPILEAAERAGVGRVVLVSVFGAGPSLKKASWFAKLVYRSMLGRFLADKDAGDRLLTESGLDYTIVYPVNLKSAPRQASTGVKLLDDVGRVPGLPTLPFANAGEAIARIAADPSFAGKRVVVTTATGWTPAT